MCAMQDMARCRCDVASLVRRILRRKVCVLVQGIRNATGHLRPRRLRRDWRHSRNATLWEKCRDSPSSAIYHVVLLVVPAPFLLQMIMDESNSPTGFLFDLFEDLDYFFLFSANSEKFASYCKASDGCRSDAPEEMLEKTRERGLGFHLPIFDVSHDPTNLPCMI
jgi:hypothetical protein